MNKKSLRTKIVIMSALLLVISGGALLFNESSLSSLLQITSRKVTASETIDVWWPTQDVKVNNTQPFKALLKNKALNEYQLFWRVDGGNLNSMGDSYNDYPHKEAIVDLSGWTWRGEGPYAISFVAKDTSGNEIAQISHNIYIADYELKAGNKSVSPAPIVAAPTVVTVSPIAQASPTITEPQPVITVSEPVQAPVQTTGTSVSNIEIWWPQNNSEVRGVQPIKGVVKDKPVGDYRMYWKIGNGNLVPMETNYNEYPHKEAQIDFTPWTWKGVGPYEIKVVATTNQGATLAEKTLTLYTGPRPTTVTTTTVTETPNTGTTSTVGGTTIVPSVPEPSTGTQSTTITAGKGMFATTALYVDPNSQARSAANSLRTSNPQNAALLDKIANQSTGIWLGNWNQNVETDVRTAVGKATSQNQMPVFVAYNIPGRDCGSYSAGGANNANAYRTWIQAVANGIGNGKAVVILEPDALASSDCLSSTDRATRTSLLSEAITTLKAKPNVAVYLDAGHPFWLSTEEISRRLLNAGVARADGFALNVSNFQFTSDNVSYGEKVSALIGGKHFVIDTSRNGRGANGGEWCNPRGRALGISPSTSPVSSLVDSYLWIKKPGESDGWCNGGPSAGTWWTEYALELSRNSQ